MGGRGCTPLVVVCGPPEDHDDGQDDGEEKMPEGVIDPNLTPVLQDTTSTVSRHVRLPLTQTADVLDQCDIKQ